MAQKTKQKTKPKRKNSASTAKTKKKKTANKKKISAKAKLSPKQKKTAVAVCAVLLTLIIIITALAAGNKSNVLSTDSDVAYGIDVSSHNGKIDWKTASDNIDFAFIRVGYRGYTEGEINADKYSKRNLKGAQKAGVPIGVYVYSQAITAAEAKQEAQFALDAIKRYDVSLPVFIDCEYAYANGKHTGRLYNAKLSRKEMTDIINAFCKTVKDAGYTPGVYASTYFYESVFNPDDITHNAVIWVADYNKEITYDGDYDIWQSSDSGKCDGVPSKSVDTDYWYLKSNND